MENLLRSEFRKTPEDAHDIKVLMKRSVFGRSEVMQQAYSVYNMLPAGFKVVIDFDYQRPQSWHLEKDE
jgi:hypothetical protein